jgi:hypothetical protein
MASGCSSVLRPVVRSIVICRPPISQIGFFNSLSAMRTCSIAASLLSVMSAPHTGHSGDVFLRNQAGDRRLVAPHSHVTAKESWLSKGKMMCLSAIDPVTWVVLDGPQALNHSKACSLGAVVATLPILR